MSFGAIVGFFVENAAAISAATMAAGTAMQMSGAHQAAKSEAALYKYNAALDRREAQQRRTASLDEQRIRRDQMRRTLKRQRVGVAKAGIQMRGSPFEAQLATVEAMSSDIAMLAYGRELEATGLEARAGIGRYRAGAARQAGRIGVATALVGGISDISKLGIRKHLAKQPTTVGRAGMKSYFP